MNPKKISFSFLCLTLILTFASLSFSEEQTKEAQCHTTPDKVPSLKDNCACNSLLSVFKLLNIDINENELSTLLPLDKDGLTSMYDLLQASKKKGLSPKALNLTYEQLTKTDMPVIVHLNTQHFITLKEVKDDGIIVIDNNSKETFIPKEEFLTKYSGHSIVFDSKVKGIALSNNQLKQIKGAHCTCGGCSAADCNTGICGGALSCSPSNCGGTCSGGGICYWCPDKAGAPCGGNPCRCAGPGVCCIYDGSDGTINGVSPGGCGISNCDCATISVPCPGRGCYTCDCCAGCPSCVNILCYNVLQGDICHSRRCECCSSMDR